MREKRIAVVGFECKYPDADNARQLWQNILSKRRAFRTMPRQRLNGSYFSADVSATDQIYTNKVAVLKNYSFDRLKFKISNSNFHTADLTHWLALDVATAALQGASLENLPADIRKKTGVIVGNTLTGEFSRANLMRLRWPYVAGSIAAALKKQGWNPADVASFLSDFEKEYKEPFPQMEEDSLAGGLSNTIAGRICNYFDFMGGGYTIDGACSSSLLAVSKACDAIANDELLISVVGGVDLSLDPFELVGFSRTGALAKKEMLVYDKHSNGFWPGEGCGFIVLADYEFAKASNLNIHATINGWGISSDGKGGLTRPSADGQYLALQRAYQKAGYGIDTVTYLEGHGTGTNLGDATELTAIVKALDNQPPLQPVHIGSVKANIGHTKAASGIAGLIKCLMVLKNRIIPAASGVREPSTIFQQTKHLKLPNSILPYEGESPMRAGVSSMGFGGINTHITLEEHPSSVRKSEKVKAKQLSASYQDSELFLFAERDTQTLLNKLKAVYEKAGIVSLAELTDLSCSLYEQLQNFPCRVALEAATPDQLASKISRVMDRIRESGAAIIDNENGIYFSTGKLPWKIGFLFPGQGNEALQPTGLLHERFPSLPSLLPDYLKNNNDRISAFNTGIAQPAIVSTSVAAVKFLDKLGVKAQVALGHSLGELSALYWAKALNENDVVALAKERGRLMHHSEAVKGQMLSVSMQYTDPLTAQFEKEFDLSVACVNGPAQIVFSGSKDKINELYTECKNRKIPATLLQVENAFHSKLMAALEEPFARCLSGMAVSAPAATVYSTVSADIISDEKEIHSNLLQQLTGPVLFQQTFEKASGQADLWIEAGPGTTLEKLTGSIAGVKSIALDFTGKSVKGLLRIAGALFVSDNPVDLEMIFENRFYRTLLPEDEMNFIEGPCEKVPAPEELEIKSAPARNGKQPAESSNGAITLKEEVTAGQDIGDLFKTELAKKLDLPVSLIFPHTRMLDDLHLNSLFVGQLLADFARKYSLAMTDTPTEYANASVEEIVGMFTLLQKSPAEKKEKKEEEKSNIEGISSWVFPFQVSFKEASLPQNAMDAFSNNAANVVIGNVPGQLSGIEKRALVKDANNLLVFLYAEEEAGVLDIFRQFLNQYKNQQQIKHIVFIQERPVGAGFAKSLFLETPNSKIRVIEIPSSELTQEILSSEMVSPEGFVYARYEKGTRFVPELSALINNQPLPPVLPNSDDMVLVTGGAKGITFECVRELAVKSNCKLVLLGRSHPEKDEQIRQNLAILQQQGIDAAYYIADVSDPGQLANAVAQAARENKRITGIIHGAGINKPAKVTELKYEQLLSVLGAKLFGLRNVLGAVDTEALKFCITFGSIIGESGMEGNADYALANEWLRNEIAALSKQLPATYFLNMAWSVWGGTGMGQNLGVLEHLKQRGIHPITLDTGIKHFMRVFDHPYQHTSVVLTGRHGSMPTLGKKIPDVQPIYRFIENIKVFYPDVELIADCVLSEDTDLYMKDHMPGGKMVLPGVFGMEAMAQAVTTLTGTAPESITFENVSFMEPVIMAEGKSKTIRIIVQRINSNTFSAAIRDESTAFKKDHFKAFVITDAQPEIKAAPELNGRKVDKAPSPDTRDDLYHSLLFHKGVFRKIKNYRHLDPYHCEVYAECSDENYFSDFLPKNLLLNNPGLNDAALHAVQACVPNYTLLPVSMEKVSFPVNKDYEKVLIKAKEINHNNDEYTYDIVMEDHDKNVLSSWKGVKFKVLHEKVIRKLSPLFMQLVLQRKINGLLGDKNKGHLHFYSDGETPEITKRGDGKPLLSNRLHITKSHNGDQTLLVESEAEIAVDIETIEQRTPGQWVALLGTERAGLAEIICKTLHEDYSSAATRVWCAVECLRKAGVQTGNPLVLHQYDNDGTAYLTSGSYVIITYKCILKNNSLPQVQSLLLKNTQYEEI